MKTMTFKVNEEESRVIRALAKRQGLSLSEYLRRQAAGRTMPDQELRRVRCPFTGAMIFSLEAGVAPLTSEAVVEMLADFP